MSSPEPAITWDLRISRRARYARLQIKPYGGLEVVVPPRFPRREIPRLVEKHADWIRLQLDKQSALSRSIELPGQISLAFDQSSTPVYYVAKPDLQDHGDCLFITADDYHARVKMLRGWVRQKAHDYFPDMLDTVARRCDFSYRRLSIRSQKTRWGSCNAQGNISLNDQLLFLPRDCAEYLMVHELCHTRYLNHSQAFWALVESHCPDYRQQERLLKQARASIPQWYLRDLYR